MNTVQIVLRRVSRVSASITEARIPGDERGRKWAVTGAYVQKLNQRRVSALPVRSPTAPWQAMRNGLHTLHLRRSGSPARNAFKQRDWVDAKRFRDLEELDYVEPAFTGLGGGDEGLRSFHSCCQCPLSYPSFLT